MPGTGEISLAVIAAAAAVATGALVPALVQVRRTAARAEEVLRAVGETLPGLLRDTRALVDKLDRVADTVHDLAGSASRLDRVATTAARTVVGMRDVALQVAREMVVPSMANAAGLLAILRDTMQWLRPRRDNRREGP